MARAGDGHPRSARRRATLQIALRVTPAAKAALQQRALAAGYPNLSAWMVVQLAQPNRACPAATAVFVGHLGLIGGRLRALAGRCDRLPPDEMHRQLHALNLSLAKLQADMVSPKGETP